MSVRQMKPGVEEARLAQESRKMAARLGGGPVLVAWERGLMEDSSGLGRK